jgi:hypothetical protein
VGGGDAEEEERDEEEREAEEEEMVEPPLSCSGRGSGACSTRRCVSEAFDTSNTPSSSGFEIR